jgi:hypothetical protein
MITTALEVLMDGCMQGIFGLFNCKTVVEDE